MAADRSVNTDLAHEAREVGYLEGQPASQSSSQGSVTTGVAKIVTIKGAWAL